MSPQFVDYDADGTLDIVAGIFDGSPHLSRGSKQGWLPPEQILAKDGQRIVGNQFWNFDTKKWENTNRSDAPGHTGSAHLTSAVVFDVDGDGDLDLLLGDHSSGRIFVRTNEGTREKPVFGLVNVPLQAGGAPIDVPGTVSTLRLVDWDGDGRLDLLVSSMGDVYGERPGGGVWLYPNPGSAKAAAFGTPIELIPSSSKGANGPVRPDTGLYADAGDVDGDGDLDLVVGGYANWKAKAPDLTAEQKQRVAELHTAIDAQNVELGKLQKLAEEAAKGLDEAAAGKKYTEAYQAQKEPRAAIQKQLAALRKELDPLEPSSQRESFVWYYENTSQRPAAK